MRKSHRKDTQSLKSKSNHRLKANNNKTSFVQIQSPYKGMAQQEIIEHHRAKGEAANSVFTIAFQELQQLIKSLDPIHLLSMFGFYDLNVSVTKSGQIEDISEERPIYQPDAELVQAITLQSSWNATDCRPVMPEDFTKIRELNISVRKTFNDRRSASLDPSMSMQQIRRLETLEVMRSQTQLLRGWAYPQKSKRILTQLFMPLDDEIERSIGVRIEHLIDMFFGIVETVEERIAAHKNLLVPMIRATTVQSAVEEYCRSFNLSDETDGLTELVKERNLSLDGVRSLLLSHSDLSLPSIFIFNVQDFASKYMKPINPSKLQVVLESLAYSFGELSTYNPEHFFLSNPIWYHPLIRLNEDSFFYPIVNIFNSFPIEMTEEVVKLDPEIFKKYEILRGDFLEEEIEKLFKSAMPSARVYRGSQWHDSAENKDFENDILVLIDSHLIVVEAKSGKVTAPARRGGEQRLQHTIQKLLIDASEQANQFANYLEQNRGVHKLPNRSGGVHRIDTSNISKVIRLNITLDTLGTLNARWPDLQEAGFIPEHTYIAPTITLADLEIIFEILTGTCQKLHYLIRRAEFEVNVDYIADELDLLAFYIETGFNVGEAEFENVPLIIYGMSKAFDPYFMSQFSGVEVSKPHPHITNWWLDTLRQIEERQPSRWTEMGYILLNLSYEDQCSFEDQFKRVQRIVKSHWRMKNHKNVILHTSGPSKRRTALAGLAYKQMTIEKRNEWLREAGANVALDAPSDRAVVIGVDIDRSDYPYSIIACFLKDEAV
ncbi:MAG: hypothetical protein JO316_16365 [Abitibacteriaceae bacterium]|nr:hypothetical protein [Abditibacteriaceae bacterium]MBV9866927.1 hypothetical protein [Abditibacteriaceae bacterium]